MIAIGRCIGVAGVLMVGLLACQVNQTVDSGSERAQCLVCKHNGDLGCVNVKVDAETPQAVVDGRTYYFCSDECRVAFIGEPARYLAR